VARARNKKYATRLNPFNGKQERVTGAGLGPIFVNPRKPRSGSWGSTIGGTRKRRTTPGAPLPFSYGWESVYRRKK
jgi:hypothetical protein